MAPLQKRALYSLVIGVVFAIALIVIFVAKGDVTTFDEDLGFRLIVYALWVGVPLAYLIVVSLTLRKPGQVDERDRLIMEPGSTDPIFGSPVLADSLGHSAYRSFQGPGASTSYLLNLNNDIHPNH